eukprot:TRINITY_DN112026_c0_g1_i1.p2 TRINITY_DN112026_c0_g1~~TRINITY_DN112026_c0_g1_i1.p2  ORF type:complete len:120 (-),score=18.73 TRINITY_DN112026_c0_g1_i1:4-363(-)
MIKEGTVEAPHKPSIDLHNIEVDFDELNDNSNSNSSQKTMNSRIIEMYGIGNANQITNQSQNLNSREIAEQEQITISKQKKEILPQSQKQQQQQLQQSQKIQKQQQTVTFDTNNSFDNV